MREIVVASGNADKLRELQRLLKPLRIRVYPVTRFGKPPRVVENGRTFEANAYKKAKAYSKFIQTKKVPGTFLVLADDSGLCVDALGGEPGVYSARFAGPGCTYEDNNRKLIRLLRGKKGPRRGAKFVSVVALYDRGRRVAAFRGEARGAIADKPAGTKGFGYDPVFVPSGMKKTFAELSPAQKNKISHRGKALRAVCIFLKTYFS